jgi:integration host factor subunit beta
MGRHLRIMADTASAKLEIPLRTGREFLALLLEMIEHDVVYTGRLEIRGLGTFAVHRRPPRKVKHPKTGKPILIPARQAVRYRASKKLKERLNPKHHDQVEGE